MHLSFVPSSSQPFLQPVKPQTPRFLCATNPPQPSPPASKQKRTLLSRNLPILPLLVKTARFSWQLFWKLLMSELAPSDEKGRYIRPTSSISKLPPPLDPNANYILYTGVACQWCHRVLLAKALLNISNVHVCPLQPGDDGLWKLQEDNTLLRQIYLENDPNYIGRFTAPLLLKQNGPIVSNESAHILKLFAQLAQQIELDQQTIVCLIPHQHNQYNIDVEQMHIFCNQLYHNLNDGVYRCGFATSQYAYEQAQQALFQCLDQVELRLANSRFLFSQTVITEADVRLFPTVYRFDAVYSVLFKASRKSIRHDYPSIADWIRGTCTYILHPNKPLTP